MKKVKLTNNSIITTKKFTDYQSLLKHLNDKMLSHVRNEVLRSESNKKYIVTADDVMTVLTDNLTMYVEETEIEYSNIKTKQFYIEDYDSILPILKPVRLNEIIGAMLANNKTEKNKISFKVTSHKKIVEDVSLRLNDTDIIFFDNIYYLNKPPKYIILTENAVVNLKTNEYSTDLSAFGDYHFVNYLPYEIKELSEVNPVKLEIVKRIFKDWSDNDPDKELYLKQLCYAAMEGNGRNVFNIIIGPGGNGKSAFLNILENLSDPKFTTKLNIQDLMDDNKLTGLDSTTKLLVGHDLATNARFTSILNSRLKELVTGESFLVNVKYQAARSVKSYCLKIQSTNTLPEVFENNDAMRRRIKLFRWTDTNFTKLTDERKFNLDMLIGSTINSSPDKEFYEALIAYIFDSVTYFDTFLDIKSMSDDVDEMINNSDAVYNFLDWFVEEELNQFKYFPTLILYELYKTWHWQNNPRGVPLKLRGFTDRLKNNLEKFNLRFSDNQTRITKFSALEFNFDYINETYFSNNLKFNKKTKINYIISNNEINQTDLDNFKLHEILSTDDLTVKELIMLDYLVQQGNTEAILIKNS